MDLNQDRIQKTERFLREAFFNSPLQKMNPEACTYRLEHSFRVANIGRQIAEREGFDPGEMVIACLLHDIAYCQPLDTQEARANHGRLSAQIVRPFLEDLGFPQERIPEICYGIAIHVDGKADFEGVSTAFAETVSDSDNIDRFDAYRIYETLDTCHFREMSLADKRLQADSTLQGLYQLKDMPLATKTANILWQDRIEFCISFYERLKRQLTGSAEIVTE